MKEKHKFKKLKILMVLVILSAVVFGGYKGVQAFFTDHAVLKAQITTGTWNYQLAVDPGMSNKKVRASWKAPSGGKQDSNGVTLYDHQEAQTVIHLPDPTLQGYTFAGWKPAEGNAGTLDAKAKTYTIAPVSRKDLITGQWTPNPDTKYTVYHLYQKLDGTYASISDADADGVKTTDHLTGTTDTDVTPAVKGRTGFTSPATQTISIKPDGSAQVIYQYTRNQYNIDLNAYIDKKMNYSPTAKYMTADITVNGKKVATGVSDYVGKAYYGSKVHIDVHPAKGRSYDGWQYGSVDYTMGAAGYSPTPIINTIQYSISYTMKGGTNNVSNPSSYNVDSDDITLQQPTRSGYGFTGWTGSNDLSTGLDGYTAANPYTAAGRDHILGGEFAVTPGTTYRVYVIGKQTKGTLALNGGIWYTAQTSGAGYDTYGGAFTKVADAGNGYSLYYKDVKVPDGKSKARFYVQIEQGSTNGSTAWSLYDMHVVTDAKNVTIPSGSIGNRSYTAHWKITSGEAVAKDLTYNGNPQDLVAPSGIPADAKIQYSLDNKTFSDAIPQKTDAGSYPVYYRITGPDAEAKTGSVTARIKPKAATVTSGSASKEYDGTPLVNHTITTTGFIGTQGVDASYTGSRTNVGSSDNAFSYTAKSGTNLNNYSITKKNGTLTITNRKTPWAITVESKSANATYDGKQHSVSGFVTLTFTEGSQTFTVSGLSASGSGTNAGSYPDTITGTAVVKRNGDDTDVTKQFSITQKTGTLVIGKAHPTFTLSEKTGTTKYPSNHKFTVSVNSNGDMTAKSADTSVATVALTNGNAVITPVKVGKTTITIHAAETSNYFAGDTTYEITVTPGTITVTKTDVHVTYDEKAHKAGTVTVTAPSSGYTIEYQAQGSNTWTTTMPSYTNAGTYQTKYRVTAANYDQASGTITTIIDKAPQGAPTIHNPALTYNGTQGDNGTAQSLGYVTPGKGGTTPVTYSTSANGTFSTTVPTGTDAGTYTTYYFIKGDANHLDYTGHSFQTVINKKQSAVALTPASGTQNYPDKGSFTYTFNGDGTISASVDQNSATVAVDQTNRTVTVTPKNVNKTVTVTVTGSAGKNWLGSSANYTVKINNQYHVTYNGNGADSGSMNPDTVTYGDDYKTKQNAFTRTGYSFNGWNEAANGSGTAWGLGSNGVYESGKTWRWTYDHDITLYAQWKINQYTASFNGNGGSNGASITKNYNAQLGTLPTSTRTGYTFDGWYTDAAGGSKISSSTTMPAHNVTYYAHWKINTYLVTFDANGGNGATPHSVARQYNQQIGWPAGAVTPVNGTVPPNNAGADSNGKMKKESVNEAASSNGKAVKLSRTAAGTANGGYYYGCGALTAGNTYTFSVVAKGKGRWLIGQEQGGEYAEVLGDNYTRYTWTFTANNSQYHAIVFYDQDKNADDYIQFYDVSLIPNDGDPTTLATVSRTGYTFAGWYTAKSGGTQVSGAEKMPANDLTYYAHWTPNNYTVTYEDWFVDKNNGRQVKLGSTTKSKPMDSTVNGNELGTDTKSGAYYGSYVYRSSTSAKVTTSGATVYRYFWAWTDLNIYNAAGAQNGGTVAFSVDGTNFTDVTNESNTIQPYGTTYTIKNIRPKNDYEEYDRVQNLTLNNGVYTYTPTKAGTSMNIWMRYKTYTISYNYNGGSMTGQKSSYTIETDDFTLPTPTKSGWTFTGWSGTGLSGNANKTVTVKKGSTGNRSYTAHWSKTITLMQHHGSNVTSSQSYTLTDNQTNHEFTLVTSSQKYDGWTFIGWRKSKTAGPIGGADTYGPTDKITISADTDVYSSYSRVFTSTFKDYNGTTQQIRTVSGTAYGNGSAGGVGNQYPGVKAPALGTRTGWTGIGYRKNGTLLDSDIALSSGQSYTLSEDATYYGTYKQTVTLKYAANGGSSTPASQTATRYANTGTTSVSKVTFKLAAAITSTGHTFTGWSVDNNIGKQAAGATITVPDGVVNVTATAQWATNGYYLDLNGNLNGTGQGSISPAGTADVYINGTARSTGVTDFYQQIDYGSTYEIKNIKANAGWVYNGVASGSLTGTMPANYVGVSLKFTGISYSVKFNANGGSGTMANEVFTYGQAKALTANAFTRTGYTFAGWATSAGGAKVYNNSQSVSNLTTTANGVVNLYAKWTPNTYTVTYNANGGGGSMSNQTATYDADFMTTKNAFSRTGYSFNGWNDKADGTGVAWGLTSSGVYESGKPWKWTYTHGITLYAQWKIVNYPITYNLDGGSVSGNPTSYNINTDAFTLKNPTKTGFTFTGWTGSNGSTAQTSYTQPKGQTGNKTYTAHWSRNNYNLNLHYKLDGGNEQSTGGTALFSYTIKYTAPGGKEQTVTGDGTKSISIPYGSTYSISIKTKQNKATLLNNESGYSASQVYWSGTLPAGGTTVIVPLMSIKGKVEVTETNWNADNAKNKAPGSVVKKNPAVKSTASYAGWPVVKVIVPNIQTKTGNQTTYTDKPIATYTVNNGWTLVKSESLGSKGNAYYYVAASQLAAGGTSGTVFDQITLAPDAKAVNGNFASQINVSAALIAGNKPDGSNDAWNQAYLLLNLDKAVPYRIRHMQQDLSGNYTITADTEIYMGIPGNSYSITGKSYTGFTAASTNATSITCTADGEASVDLHYSRNSYAINVKAGSGIKSVSGGGTYKYGQTVTIGAVVKDGYKWSGWSDGSKSQSRTMTVPAGGGTYTASAGVITYGISYNLNNGTVNGTNPASYTVESGQITLVNPTRQGYTFQGWTGTGLSGLTKTVTIPTGSTGDRSYTANFTPTTHKIRYHRNRGDESDKTTKHGMTGTEVDNNTGEQTTYEIYDTEILPNGFTWD